MVKLILYNIHYGSGQNGSFFDYLKFWRQISAPKKIIKKITEDLKEYNPDILALLEVDLGSIRTNMKNHVSLFRKHLKMFHQVSHIKYSQNSQYKFFHHTPFFKHQANAILAKNKFEQEKMHFLSSGTKRLVIEATLDLGRKVTFLLVHLSVGKKTREGQLKELIDIVNTIKNPVILLGDFNTFHGEKELDELLSKTKLTSHVEQETSVFTYPAHKPKVALDHILTSKEISVKNYSSLFMKHSDHLPLFVEFDVKKN